MTTPGHIHLTAICGTGMGAFAGMLKERGYRVTGSDQDVYPPMSTHLASLGIEIRKGYSPSNLDDGPDLVVIGNAIRSDNPEARAAFERNIRCLSFPAALSELFLEGRHSIVVAGTHGKTTTSSILAWVLERAGLSPGFLIGGILKNFGTGCQVGKGKYFVVEGDEYDTAFFDKGPKFLHYQPKTAVITSVEFDHGDIYRDLEHVKSAFSKFLSIIPPEGLALACSDYPHLMELLPGAKCPVETYGFSRGALWNAKNIRFSSRGASFRVMRGAGLYGSFEIPLPGRQNIQNTLAVIAVTHHLGINIDTVRSALAEFKGIRRRQEIFAEVNGITLIDDFAHHPTKVRETVFAIRKKYPGRRLWAVFEPRTNTSRRNYFQKEYLTSFEGADRVILAGIFHPDQIDREMRLDPGLLAEGLFRPGREAFYIPGTDEIVSFLASEARPGDVVLIMSNGGFDGIYEKLPGALRQTEPVSRKGA
jgi:UDP-N-acetylmuramate: L-alanyl-gamma-D-glutamyl-meso-diaminopimelate ligase